MIEFTLTKTVQDKLTATVTCTRKALDAAVAEAHPGKTFEELEDWEQYDVVASFAYGGDPDFQYSDGESLGAEITDITTTDEDAFPQTEEEAITCPHGNRVWFGHECGLCGV